MFLEGLRRWDWRLTAQRKAYLVRGFLYLLVVVGVTVFALPAWKAAHNPPLGWSPVTRPDVYLPPNVHLKPAFVNILTEDVGWGGGVGIGDAQIEEFEDDYPALAEAEGSYNILDLSKPSNGGGKDLLFTYVTYPEAEKGVHVFQRVYEETIPQANWGIYTLNERGANRSRIEDGVLELHWSYAINAGVFFIVFPLVTILGCLVVAVMLRLLFPDGIATWFRRRTLRG